MPRLLLASCAAISLGTSGALAAVTADDVWTGLQATYAAIGVDLTATATRDGATVTLSGITGTYAMPMQVGTLTIRTGDLVLTEWDDGTVTTSIGTAWPVSLSALLTDGVSDAWIKLEVEVAGTGHQTVIAGDPAALVMTTAWQRLDMRLGQLGFGGEAEEFEGATLQGFVSIENGSSLTTITRDPSGLITLSASGSAPRVLTDVGVRFDGQALSQSVSEQQNVSWSNTLILPAGGIDVMNLAPALRAGLSVVASSTAVPLRSESVTSVDGQIMSRQTQEVGVANQTLRLDRTGLELTGTLNGLSLGLASDMMGMLGMPPELSAEIANVSGRLMLPLLTDGGVQEAALALTLDQLNISPDLWGMIAPGATELHQPLSLNLSAVAQVLPRMDLVDFYPLAIALDAEQVVIEPRDFAISLGPVAWAGAEANLALQGSFDFGDIRFYGQTPAPEGTGTVDLAGIGQLLDKLSAAGLLPAGEAMMVRAALGGYLTSVGADRWSGNIEFSSRGLFVNGQRID